jgi:hypothetical protein
MQKMVPGLALVLVAGSVAYYFAFYLPGKQDLENSRRCSADGLSFSHNYQRNLETTEPNSDRHWGDAEVHFSRKMNTCLVEIKWDEMLQDELGRSAVVVDLYKNRKVISTHYSAEDEADAKTYLAEREKLFKE